MSNFFIIQTTNESAMKQFTNFLHMIKRTLGEKEEFLGLLLIMLVLFACSCRICSVCNMSLTCFDLHFCKWQKTKVTYTDIYWHNLSNTVGTVTRYLHVFFEYNYYTFVLKTGYSYFNLIKDTTIPPPNIINSQHTASFCDNIFVPKIWKVCKREMREDLQERYPVVNF